MLPEHHDCPSCGAKASHSRGRIPDASSFAGQRLYPPMPGGALAVCSVCSIVFRSPRPEKATLDALYRSASDTHWSADAEARPDFTMMRLRLEAALPQGGRVLDVGCFDGTFLNELPASFRRFGIEINGPAASVASTRGVEIVGSDFAQARVHGGRYHAITSIDSIEHALRPLEFLRDLASMAEPGGWIFVASGNSEARTWRWMGGRYWYCANPEHVCFVNRQWAKWAAAETGLESVDHQEYAHSVPNALTAARQLIANGVYRYLPRVLPVIRAIRNGRPEAERGSGSRDMPPNWNQAKDHVLLSFRKPLAS